MERLTSLLGKLSVEDIEKLKLLMSFNAETKEVVTLRVFSDEYKILIKNNRSASYLHSVTIALNNLLEFFGSQKVVNSITQKDVESFQIYLQQKIKKGYVVYYRNLKAAFNKAKDWGYVKENYFTKVKLPKRQKTAPAFINSDQLSAIGNQIKDDVVRDVVTVGFYTGMRLNEIVNLKWKNANLSARIITVGDEEFITKGRNQRFIPVSDEALIAFHAQRERRNAIPIGDSYVFCKSNGEKFTGDHFSRRFKSACKKAGIDKSIHFHSLRHSFASNLAQQGVSLYKIKELLGHASITTTEIYSHLNIDSLRDAISKLDDISPERINSAERMDNNEKGKFTTGLRIITTNK
ncbi:MAG: tyrosine-type recombinase/integrase [Bacteroidetes bacterium]|nr:tyrosine-type recombinase/integrase [Bacteroidota bacterium]